MTTSGPLRFARYAYPPNALGYCGPADAPALLEYSAAGVTDPGLADLARRFEGAWPYLALIAAASGREDPLDPAVVEAYWLGNPLLETIPPSLLIAHLEERFQPQLGWGGFTDLALIAAAGGRAHHNFHVFAVYPWVGMLRVGKTEHPVRVLDSCRVRWGRVVAVTGSTAEITSRPLCWTGSALALGLPRAETVRRARSSGVEPGDWVSAHWDWACERLSMRQVNRLSAYTTHLLHLVNRTLDRPVADAVMR